ncbi:MAG: hypothetical protein ACR2M4_02935 [Actinomycetota bacterium]
MIDIRTKGLDTLPGDLTAVRRKFVDGARDLENELADDVAKKAKGNAARDILTGEASGSIRAMGPKVTAGEGVDHYAFADFGGRVGIRKSVKRPFIRGGRYLFPAAKEVGVIRRAEKMIDQTTKEL